MGGLLLHYRRQRVVLSDVRVCISMEGCMQVFVSGGKGPFVHCEVFFCSFAAAP